MSLVEIRPGRSIFVQVTSCEVEHAPIVFFLHGSMASFEQFRPQMDSLCASCHVIAYDALGCSEADKPKDPCCAETMYSEDEMGKDAYAVWERWGNPIVEKDAETKVVLVGHSFGSALALRLCRNISVDSLVLIGASPEKPSGASHPVFCLPEVFIECLRPMMNEAFVSNAFHPESDPSLAAAARAQSGLNPVHVIRAFYLAMRWDIHRPIPDVPLSGSNPFDPHGPKILLVHGAADGLTPLSGARRLAREFERVWDATDSLEDTSNFARDDTSRVALCIISRAAHLVMLETPHLLNGFLHGLTTSPPKK